MTTNTPKGGAKANGKTGASDECQTPPYAIKPLLKYLPDDAYVWDCADGDGYIARVLSDNGFMWKAMGKTKNSTG